VGTIHTLLGQIFSKLQEVCNFKGQIARVISVRENALGKTSLVELQSIAPIPYRRSLRIIAYQATSFFMLLVCRKKSPRRTAFQISALFILTLPLLIPACTVLYRKVRGTPVIASTIIEGEVVRKIVSEWSTNLQIQLPDRKMILWKEGQRKENISEVSASPLAAYLTGGTVPIARMGKRKDEEGIYQEGTFQPFLELDSDSFVSLLKDDSFNFNFLNHKQIHQLFCHVIADCIIFNFDTHQGQYALNGNRDVVSLDKGQAFALFDLNQDPVDYLDLAEDRHLTDSVVSRRDKDGKKLYVRISSTFVREMKSNRRLSPSNSILQNFFKRCESISQAMIEEYLNPFAKEFYPGKEKEFISFMFSRIRSIKPAVYRYFDWECA
jgi:hypothetical protein